MEHFTRWYVSLMERNITIGDAIVYGFIFLLFASLMYCIIKDEPLAYISFKGNSYKVCCRHIEVLNDDTEV